MLNPFKTPAHENEAPNTRLPQVNTLLLLLAIITTWMLTNDTRHLFAISTDSLTKAAGVSIFHYTYIKIAPLEIACLRIFSSIAILVLIVLTARNPQSFTRYYLPSIAYGITQLIYQALAISGVAAILTKAAGRSIVETSFWLAPEMLSSTMRVLSQFLVISAPSILFLAGCLVIKRLITRAKTAR